MKSQPNENPDQPEVKAIDHIRNFVAFEVNYYSRGEFSHSRSERWEALPDLHCPHCGEKRVWHDTSPGDIYLDERYMCASCGAGWHLPGGVRPIEKEDVQGKQRFVFISKTEMMDADPGADSDLETMRDHARKLEIWKHEAMIVLAEWNAVWEIAGKPGMVGHSKAKAVAALFNDG